VGGISPHNFFHGGWGGEIFCSHAPLVGDSWETPLKWNFGKKCIVKYYNFVVNIDRSLQGRGSDDKIHFRVFFPRRQPSLMRELYCGCVLLWMLYSETGDCERKKRKLHRVCFRLYPFILLDNKKEGPGNFTGGRSPHWVNQVYMCLYCIVYFMCFIYAFVLFYCFAILFF
jgi:hypothetical protein